MTKRKDINVDGRGKSTPPRKTVNPGKEKKVSQLVKNNFEILDLGDYKRAPRFDETDYIIELVNECVNKCVEREVLPNIRLLCAYMRISYRTFYKWVEKEETPTSKYLRSVQNALAGILEQGALSGDINNISAIFLLKSTHGYQEVNEMNIKIEDNSNTGMTKEQIAERIDNDIIDVDIVEREE